MPNDVTLSQIIAQRVLITATATVPAAGLLSGAIDCRYAIPTGVVMPANLHGLRHVNLLVSIDEAADPDSFGPLLDGGGAPFDDVDLLGRELGTWQLTQIWDRCFKWMKISFTEAAGADTSFTVALRT